MKAEIMEVVALEDLPTLVRIARRGRPAEAIEAETCLSHATLRRAERGDLVDIRTIMKIADWTSHAIVVRPGDLKFFELFGQEEELGLEDSAP